MLRRWRKAAFRRFVFPKRLLSPHGTRAAGHRVPTHIMPRAALKQNSHWTMGIVPIVPTHTMLRAALKHRKKGQRDQKESGPDTHNAACGIETGRCWTLPWAPEVPTHIMPRAALTAKWLCVSFRSHRAVFVCEKRTAILTMRRTDVRIEIQKGHCRAVAPIISRDSPAKVCSARRGFLIYR